MPIEDVLDQILKEVQALREQRPSMEEERLLSAKEAAKILGVSPGFLYLHGKEFPFTVTLNQEVQKKQRLGFSKVGIQKWLARQLKIQEARCATNPRMMTAAQRLRKGEVN